MVRGLPKTNTAMNTDLNVAVYLRFKVGEMARFGGLRTVLIVSLCGCLLACSSSNPIPEDRFYILSRVGELQLANSKHSIPLQVNSVKGVAIYHDRAISYGRSESPFELLQYHYQLWAESPLSMVRRRLQETLASTGMFPLVSPSIETFDAYYRLSSYIYRFDRILTQHNPKVIIEIKFQLTTSIDKEIILDEVITVEQEAVDKSMNASIAAFEIAMLNLEKLLVYKLGRIE